LFGAFGFEFFDGVGGWEFFGHGAAEFAGGLETISLAPTKWSLTRWALLKRAVYAFGMEVSKARGWEGKIAWNGFLEVASQVGSIISLAPTK
jgi:hypothetical protein